MGLSVAAKRRVEKMGEEVDIQQAKTQKIPEVPLPSSLYASRYTMVFDVK
jgi:hypothetical protein